MKLPATETARADASKRLVAAQLEARRRSRCQPRPTQFDYLHLKRLHDDLARCLTRLAPPPSDVLDVFCGSRPYEDLLPAGTRYVGLDVSDEYGSADVVTDEFLPFPDESFDLVLSTQAFHYVPDPVAGLAEIARVLRPGGVVVLTLPHVWEYEHDVLEHRFTGPELEALLADWSDVEVVENGGRAITWATLTGTLLRDAQRTAQRWLPRGAPVDRLFELAYLAVNALGWCLDRLGGRGAPCQWRMPMNLLAQARKSPAS